jgi:tellurite resistance-related uncharacterized protein
LNARFHFPVLDEQEYSEWSWLLKQSDSRPFVLEGVLVRDTTMRRPVTDKAVDKALVKLAKRRYWPGAIPWVAAAWWPKQGLWQVPLPADYLEEAKGKPFSIKSGSSRISIIPLLLRELAYKELTKQAGEIATNEIFEAYEEDAATFHELCVVDGKMHVLSLTESAQAAEEMSQKAAYRGGIFAADEVEEGAA